MIDNLKMINELGIRQFIQNEKEKWLCPEYGKMICVHRSACLSCGYKWHKGKTAQPFTGADPAKKRPGREECVCARPGTELAGRKSLHQVS